MATYAIGDLQGCYAELQALLEHIKYDPSQDQLWFAGDIVNRGPNSLEALRFVKALGDKAVTVLGNHDLHLLAVAAGKIKARDDLLDPILQASDRDELLDWVRFQPLLHYDAKLKFLLVHAGLPPQWNLKQAQQYAQEVERMLQSENYTNFLPFMYGNKPHTWDPTLKGFERLRFIVNALTRIRYCTLEGELDMKYPGPIGTQPENFYPWFKIPKRLNKKINIVFGHWASLVDDWDKLDEPRIFPVDSACVWGRSLTAIRVEDQKYFSVACSSDKGHKG